MPIFVRSIFLAAFLALTIFSGPANAQSDSYLATIGFDNGTATTSNSGFSQPFGVAVDHIANRLIVTDSVNNRIQIFDATSFAYVATIGAPAPIPGFENETFSLPAGVAVDETNRHILIDDLQHNRIQIFSADSFAYVATIGSAGSANGQFNTAVGVAVDSAHNRILVADVGNARVQMFDATSFAFQGSIGVGGTVSPGFLAPVGLAVDPVHGYLLVLDALQNCGYVLNSQSFALRGTVGACQLITETQAENGLFDYAIAADPAKNRILITNTPNNQILVFDAGSFAQTGTLGSAAPSTDNAHFNFPSGLYADQANGRLYVADTLNNRVQVFGPSTAAPIAPLVAAILPGSRSVTNGTLATVFAIVLNAGPTPLNNCRIALTSSAPPPLSMNYQTTDPSTNRPNADLSPAVTIPANGSQTFMLEFHSFIPLDAPAMPLAFTCSGAPPVTSLPGINTVDLSYSATPTADVIAMVATNPNNGILTIPFSHGAAGAFAMATDNIGAASDLTVSVDTAGVALPLTATICQTVTATSACMQTPASSIPITVPANATPTFSVFATASQPIPLSPAASRLFVRFTDSTGHFRGSTSVAVQTN